MDIIRPLCSVLLMASLADAQVDTITSALSEPYQLKLGHVYALSLQQAVGTFMRGANWDAPVLATYPAGGNLLQVNILGARSDIDNVKESVEDFRTKILKPSLTFINAALSVQVDESQIRILYTNRESGRELLVFENGSYILR